MPLSAITELCHEPHHDLYCTARNLYRVCWDHVTIYPCGPNLAVNFEQTFPNKDFWLNKFSKYFWLTRTCILRLRSQLSLSCGQKYKLMALTVYILVCGLRGCRERATPGFFHHCSLTENSRLLDAWEALARIVEEGAVLPTWQKQSLSQWIQYTVQQNNFYASWVELGLLVSAEELSWKLLWPCLVKTTADELGLISHQQFVLMLPVLIAVTGSEAVLIHAVDSLWQ